jgi:hypothetical protein
MKLTTVFNVVTFIYKRILLLQVHLNSKFLNILLYLYKILDGTATCVCVRVCVRVTDEGGILADASGILMIALTESHLRKDILDAEITMERFQHYRADRKEGWSNCLP